MNIVQRVKGWWWRERLIDALLDQVRQGTGVTHQTFPQGTTTDTVLAWIDQQIGESRTPGGFSAVKIAILGESGPPVYEVIVARRRDWYAEQQEAFTAALTPILVTQPTTVAVIAFGTMLAATLADRGPVRESSE